MLNMGVAARNICGISFTRAASKDLRLRASAYCAKNGQSPPGAGLRVTTLHSLALTTLLKANQLTGYPVPPVVLDEWELRNVFDAEFASASNRTPGRAQRIRRDREAFWVTGQLNPPNYALAKPPIGPGERADFDKFQRLAAEAYACVVPGSVVRQCVQLIHAGRLSPVPEIDVRHLIVDEYQDLNPLDIKFIDLIGADGAQVFVAGDDDQSIYSFRFASPTGIQDFLQRHSAATSHLLDASFRSAPLIVDAANTLIQKYSGGTRIPKNLSSMWSGATPAVSGVVCRWLFASDKAEASAVAKSAASLIAAGVPANEIMLLISNTKVFPTLRKALERECVAYVPPKEASWADSEGGKFVLGILRTVSSLGMDYVAYRLILGCRRGVGISTCQQIAKRCANKKLDFGDLFTKPLPAAVFDSRQTDALSHAATVCQSISTWTSNDCRLPRTWDHPLPITRDHPSARSESPRMVA